MYHNRNSGTSHNQMKLSIDEYLDRVREEVNALQSRVQNSRLEIEKLNAEKEQMQRQYVMYYELAMNSNVEAQKQAEIAKRLSAILGHVIPHLSVEQQATAVQAVERAKSINQQELQAIIGNQFHHQQFAQMLPGMAGLGSMAAMGGPAAAAAAAAAFSAGGPMAAMAAAAGLKQEDAASVLFTNFLKNASGSLPAGMLPGLGAGIQPLPGVSAVLNATAAGPSTSGTSAHAGTSGTSSSSASVPPMGASVDETAARIASLNSARAASASRPRSSAGSPAVSSTAPLSKRIKTDMDEVDELEIDVQNDDVAAGSGPASQQSNSAAANGTSSSAGANSRQSTTSSKKDGRESAQSSGSSRDSATPRSAKQIDFLPLQISTTPTQNMTMPDMRFLLNPNAYSNLFDRNLFMGPGGINMAAMAAVMNGKPTYSFRQQGESGPTPTAFPADAQNGADIPKSMKRVCELPHGEVVCAVTISRQNRHIYTGGKGCVKVWDLEQASRRSPSVAPSPAAAAVNGPSPAPREGSAVPQSPSPSGNGHTNGSAAHNNNNNTKRQPMDPIMNLKCFEDSYVRSCKLFPDESTLIVGGESETICIWDLEAQEIKANLNCQAQACYALAISEDNRLCFSCCADGNIVIWDLVSATRVASLDGHSEGASCVDLSNGGTKLWTGGLDCTVRSWDIRQRIEMDKYALTNQIYSLGCCPTEDYVAVGMENNIVEVLNTAPGLSQPEKYILHDHEACVLALKFSHSGKWFASTGKDNILNVWRTPYGYRLLRNKESASVLSCDISHDDKYIVTGSSNMKGVVYEVTY